MFQLLQPVLQIPGDYTFGGLELFGGTLCCLIDLIILIIWIYVLVWVYKDAEKRGSSGVLWALIVLFLGIIGLIIWLIVRPSVRQPVHHYYYQQPPAVAPPPAANVNYCPHCRQPMRWIPQYNRWYCDYCRQYR